MVFRKFTLFMTAVAVAAAALLIAAPAGAGDKKAAAFKLEGAWVATVPGTPGMWTYVLAPDPSGRRATRRLLAVSPNPGPKKARNSTYVDDLQLPCPAHAPHASR